MLISSIWQTLPKHFLCLAPMEGVTDVVFRQVISRSGRPDLFFTEFTNVSSFASDKGRQNALERLDIVASDSPIIAQIWGKNPAHFATIARELEKLGFDGLDINMGCPDRHVNKAGGGAAMIKTPDLALECIRQAKTNTNLPVSVKTRLGFSHTTEYTDWLSLLLQQDLAALTVHLRTRKEMSKVEAHFDLIPDIIKLRDQFAPTTKIIFNGDIKDKTHANQLFATYPAIDGLMIGRGVFSNPYCFTNHIPSKEELLNLLNYHLDLFEYRQQSLLERDSYYSFEPLKRFFKVYIHSFDGASDLRTQLMNCKTVSEVRKILQHS